MGMFSWECPVCVADAGTGTQGQPEATLMLGDSAVLILPPDVKEVTEFLLATGQIFGLTDVIGDILVEDSYEGYGEFEGFDAFLILLAQNGFPVHEWLDESQDLPEWVEEIVRRGEQPSQLQGDRHQSLRLLGIQLNSMLDRKLAIEEPEAMLEKDRVTGDWEVREGDRYTLQRNVWDPIRGIGQEVELEDSCLLNCRSPRWSLAEGQLDSSIEWRPLKIVHRECWEESKENWVSADYEDYHPSYQGDQPF